MIRTLVAWGLLIVVVGTSGVWLLAAGTPLRAQASSVHRALPLPVACAALSCVSYRQLAQTMDALGTRGDPAVVLTELLTERAAGIVARRVVTRVTDADLDAATETLGSLTAAEAGLRTFFSNQYGNLQSPEFREGLRRILLRRKLAAAGITNVWAHPAAPAVALFQFRYRWDSKEHRVAAR